ncbi:MAG: uroporphyrinogen decarboxylase [Sulfuricurvum sp.]|uniref:uroporphyrinogen decarboxylase n=1 Tax=Sulfuricurvum sp. TaxID=2025608 RepID=UPI003D0E28FA
MSKIFVDACFRRPTPHTPIWMMRQAGRYLPEYMEVRKRAGNFLNLCHAPDMACEVTIQPVERLNVDAAILFSDILVVPNEMGMELEFIKGFGPKFPSPLETQEDLDALDIDAAEKLTYVYETIRMVRARLADDKALIGFTGSPWTLATYMIEGQGTKTYAIVKKLLYTNPGYMHALLAKLTHVIKGYLERQILAGADAVQIFDSWASALEEPAFFEFSWNYMKEIADYIKTKYPHIPVLLFPKGISGFLDKIDGNFDVFCVDWSTPIELAKEKLGDRYVLQGNMEPTRLYSREATLEGVKHIIDVMGITEGHIFNLGHGMLPDLEPENAKYLVDLVHEITAR